MRARRISLITGVTAAAVWALLPAISGPVADAAFTPATDLFISPERAITDNVGSPSDCTPSQVAGDVAARTAVDAQNDGWESAAVAAGLSDLRPAVIPTPGGPDRVDVSPTPLAVPGSTVTVDVSYRNVPPTDLAPFHPAALGSPSVGSDPNAGLAPPLAYRNPYTPVPADGTLQDCAPYPSSLYDTDPSAPGPQSARQWNALYGSGSDLDGVLFRFSSPVRAFGAWFGDLETRPPATPGYVKLIAADSTVLWEGVIPATVAASPGPTQCGGSNTSTDPLACGNQTTRWIGFVTAVGEPAVAEMLVTVGDDDDCTQVAASQCDGSTEHFSWTGAMLAEGPTPEPTTTTTTSTVPTTAVPTTAVPTTAVPTTAVPTTAVPTTAVPTTAVPTTTTTLIPAVLPSATTTAASTSPSSSPPSVPPAPAATPIPASAAAADATRGAPTPPPRAAAARTADGLAFTGGGLPSTLARLATAALVLGALLLRSRRRRERAGAPIRWSP